MMNRRSFLKAIGAVLTAPVLAKLIPVRPATAAVSIPFGMLPSETFIRGSRFVVKFDWIKTPRFDTDIPELAAKLPSLEDRNRIQAMLAERRRNPRGWNVLPFPVEYQPIG